MKILITGVSGSGKSTICKELNKLGYKAYDIECIKGLFYHVDKRTGKVSHNFDNDDVESAKQHAWICDPTKLKKLINENSEGIIFYCGIGSNISDVFSLFDKVFLLKVDEEVLRKRLNTRSGNTFARKPEVQDWVFSWKTDWEDYMIKKGAIVINANQNLKETVSDIINKV